MVILRVWAEAGTDPIVPTRAHRLHITKIAKLFLIIFSPMNIEYIFFGSTYSVTSAPTRLEFIDHIKLEPLKVRIVATGDLRAGAGAAYA